MSSVLERIDEHIKTLSQFTSTPGNGTTRLTYSKEDLQARNYLKKVMEDYGLSVTEDGAGNIFGKLAGEVNGPSVLIGSHFDSVPNGGDYDGPAGVIAGLEVAKLFKDNGISPKYPLEVVALVEEEGSRFGGGLMGSRSITGKLTDKAFRELKDSEGVSTVEAMKHIGLNPNFLTKRDEKTMKAYLELHIEQGPILENEKISIGIVEGIVGLSQLEITIRGEAGHAGTTPMNGRADALVVAAQIIAKLPTFTESYGEGTVVTVGKLSVYPNGANVIPGSVTFTIDLRSTEEAKLKSLVDETQTFIRQMQNEKITISIAEQLYMSPTILDDEMKQQLEKSCQKHEFSYQSIFSGAGHDAMVFAEQTKAAMIFIPSKDGLSHCPEESSDHHDIEKAVYVLFEATKQLTEVKQHEQLY
ncbi:Zn-dependent hydrolase [Cytobacillus kochii]|uniref:Zn-dependent hydrolase n=1 Tax=Cytobacillus kochii TaxID=859143 RepID=UPI002E24D1F3|nr:Zn-dependent hydrolase [Cytobacillus kochii]